MKVKVLQDNKYAIPYLIVIIFLVIVLVLTNSRYYTKKTNEILEQNKVQEEILEDCRNLIGSTQEMTFNARYFVQTADVKYLEEYCKLKYGARGRAQVLERMKQYEWTQEAQDILHEIEVCLRDVEQRENYAIGETIRQERIDIIQVAEQLEVSEYIREMEEIPLEPLSGKWKEEDIRSFLLNREYEQQTDKLVQLINDLDASVKGNQGILFKENQSMKTTSLIVLTVSSFVVAFCMAMLVRQSKRVTSLKNMNDIMLAVSREEYLIIGQVDFDTMQILKMSSENESDNVIKGEMDYMTVMREYAETNIHSSYVEQFLRTVQPVYIMSKFEQGNKIVSCVYKSIEDEWNTIDFTRVKNRFNDHPLVCFTVKNAVGIVEQQKEQRQRDKMLMHFSREYFEVYVVDLNKGSYEIIRSAERFGNYIKNLTGDFAQLMELAIVSWPKPPYRENFRQLVDLENVKRRFYSGTGKIEFIYESYDEKWKSLQCFPVPEYGPGNEKMIFALRDFNEEMQVRTNEVLATEAMNNIYTVVASRNITANKYECIHCTEDVFDLQDKGDYADFLTQMLGLLHEEDKEKYQKELSDERLMKEGRAECEFRLRDKSGEYHYYHEYITKVEVPSGSRVAILIKNVDETKMHELWVAQQLQKELKAKAKELEMTKLLAKKSKDLEKALKIAEDANAAKSQFLSNMSHDLRTPMNAILGMTIIAKNHMYDAEQLTKCLDTILSSSENMIALINDILDMNKIESGMIELKEKPTNLHKIIDSIDSLFRSRCENNQQEFRISYDKVIHFSLILDEIRLKQILINLVSNAVKYTQSFGTIVMDVTEEPAEQADYCKLIFTVSDDGIGMSEEFLQRIFEPFEREETELFDKVEGSGLGMAIVKKMVDVMNGDIQIESRQNIGTKITVAIPFQICEQVEREEQLMSQNTLHKYPGKRILLVEDKRINMEIVKSFLENTDLQIDEARNGKEAVEKIQASKENTYDLIFMDMRMPVMKGDEATKTIRSMERQDCKEIPIIAMTANALDNDVEYSYQCGMNGHISKPIEPDEIYRCLNKWLLEK